MLIKAQNKFISIILIQILSIFILSACGGGSGSSNESPTIADASFNIPENAANGASVGTVVGNDPDGDPLTYSIVQVTAAANQTGATLKVAPEGTFAIGKTSGQITVANKAAFNPLPTEPLTITVQVADDSGETDTATVSITVTDVNLVPAGILANPNLSVANIAANGAPVGDPLGSANDGLSYSIVGGNTGNAFAIDPVTGQITVNDATAINSGSNFQLEVQVTDGVLTDTVTIGIAVEDVTLVPTGFNPNISFNGADISNGALVGGPLGTTTDGLTFSIVGGNDNGAFTIDPQTGQISIVDSSAITLGETVNLVIQITDGVLTENVTIAIAISDFVDPALINPTTPISVNDTAQNGDTVAGPFGTVDDGLTFSIIGGNDSGAFTIDPNTGEVTVSDSTALGDGPFELTIQVTNGTITDTFTITIGVNQVNVAPTLADVTIDVAASQAIGSNVGAALAATDPDQDTLSYSITAGNTGNAFDIVSTTGQITLNTAPVVGSSTLTITVSDGIATDTAVATINTFHDFQGKTAKILPFGDSVTDGQGYFPENLNPANPPQGTITAVAADLPVDAFGRSYRFEMLTHQGNTHPIAFDFIGSKVSDWKGPGREDAEYAAYSGFSTANIINGESGITPLPDLLASSFLPEADMVLMTLGINDALEIATYGGSIATQANLTKIIRDMQSVNSNLVFLIAKVLPVDTNNATLFKFGNYDPNEISTLADFRSAFERAEEEVTKAGGINDIIDGLTSLSTPTSPVVIVDMATAFSTNGTVNSSLLADGVHPNNAGEAVMAQTWVDAIEKFFDGTKN